MYLFIEAVEGPVFFEDAPNGRTLVYSGENTAQAKYHAGQAHGEADRAAVERAGAEAWAESAGAPGGGTTKSAKSHAADAAAAQAAALSHAQSAAATVVSTSSALINQVSAMAAAVQALANYRQTLAEGIADFAVDEFFASDETGELRSYKRIAGAPYYLDMGDSAAPLTLQTYLNSHLRGTAGQADFELAIAAIAASYATTSPDFDYVSQFAEGRAIEPGVYDVGSLALASHATLNLVARIPGTVVIRIPDVEYFLETAQRMDGCNVDGITFVGGKGAFHFTHTGNNVNAKFNFRRNRFLDYTECALGNEADDHPFLDAQGNYFFGAEASNNRGIAWGGYSDGMVIRGNQFARHRYHLALGPRIGGDFYVSENGFLNWTSGSTLADIWLKPSTTPASGVNSGQGAFIGKNKFGNEGFTGAPRFLIAKEDPGTGTSRINRDPLLEWSDGDAWLSGITFDTNLIGWNAPATAAEVPIVRSYIGQVRNMTWRGMSVAGGYPSYLVEFMTDDGAGDHRLSDYVSMNWHVEILASDTSGDGLFKYGVSNEPIGVVFDYAGLTGDPLALSRVTNGTDRESFLVDKFGASCTLTSATSGGAVADDYGGSKAREVIFTTSGGSVSSGVMTFPATDDVMYAVIDLAAPSANALDTVRVYVANFSNNHFAFQRRYPVPVSGKRRLIIPFAWAQRDSNPALNAYQLIVAPGSEWATGSKDRVVVERMVLVRGKHLPALGHMRAGGNQPMKWDYPHLLLGSSGHAWLDAAGVLRFKGGAPASDQDGVAIGGGMYPEEAPNPHLVGGAVGVLPTGWSTVNTTGLTLTTELVGADRYGRFVEVKIAGTASATGVIRYWAGVAGAIQCDGGETFSLHGRARLVGGSLANLNTIAGGPVAFVTAPYSDKKGASGALSETAIYGGDPTSLVELGSDTHITPLSARSLRQRFELQATSGAVVDVTLRLYAPSARRAV